jgi:CTD small phosphatase-like protein 2
LYADTILNYIDPNREIFAKRLYRQHCVETEYGLIKDLRIIKNRSLSDMLIVDNNALSFAMNVLNGVPILPFFDNSHDEELRHLTYYLVGLKDV